MPKKCEHFHRQSVIPADEATSKIKAAVDARHSENFLIIARSDARVSEGLACALERAHTFIDAGADVTFVEASTSIEELRQIPLAPLAPQFVSVVVGSKTPTLDAAGFGPMGYALVSYANAALQGAVLGMTNARTALRDTRRLDESSGLVVTFAKRQRFMREDQVDDLAQQYKLN